MQDSSAVLSKVTNKGVVALAIAVAVAIAGAAASISSAAAPVTLVVVVVVVIADLRGRSLVSIIADPSNTGTGRLVFIVTQSRYLAHCLS